VLRIHEGLTGIAAGVRHHHEVWDGSGYPDGLAEDAIPLAARIVGLADATDIMLQGRYVREKLSPEACVAELRRFAGVQFDPVLTEAMIQLIEEGLLPAEP
jgi:HD-GYP domain-containing protein (c-di-GMP phosphodiesterase class II)